MKQHPLFKATALLLFVFFFLTGLFYARNFLIPVIFATLLAMLLLPLCKRFERWGIPRVLSIILCILLVLLIISGIVTIFYSQIVSFSHDVALIEQKLLEKISTLQSYIQSKTGISAKEQMKWIQERSSSLVDSTGSIIKSLLMGLTTGIVAFGLVIIYIFLFLLYRERFKKFILKLFPENAHLKVEDVINRTKDLILHYLTGLLIALTILGTMNAIGLMALGIKQALFLGFLAGFLNIIPYVGTLIGSLFPIIMALLFKDSMWYATGVAAVFLFNQFIDNNITTPKVVGSHVQVNPLATIMAIIIGGIIWGVAGMILFIPLLGIFKIICDNVDDLKPIGYLLGEEESQKEPGKIFKKIKGFLKKK